MEQKSYNKIKIKVDTLIKKCLKNNVFTGCSVGFIEVFGGTATGDIYNYGFDNEQKKRVVDLKSVYDLASLTKPLVTVLSVLSLVQNKALALNDTVEKFFTNSRSPQSDITIYQLLNHSSGLPAHRQYHKKLEKIKTNNRGKKVVEWILTEELFSKQDKINVYSDLGYILLGNIIEKVSGYTLDEYWQSQISIPLKLHKALFFAQSKKRGLAPYVYTGCCSKTKERLSGVVNDDNCRALGGIAGHAGLFGTISGVLALCEHILLNCSDSKVLDLFDVDTVSKLFEQKCGSWLYGFDTPTVGISSSGKYFSTESIGHLGFTGTSFWLDLLEGIGVVFLTNRVATGPDLSKIKKMRPLLHNAIMEELLLR